MRGGQVDPSPETSAPSRIATSSANWLAASRMSSVSGGVSSSSAHAPCAECAVRRTPSAGDP
eukprot:7172809-Pyramimonas_sp.AAC.1